MTRILKEVELADSGPLRTAPRAGRRSVTVNMAESPLGWLHARGHLSDAQFAAGEALRDRVLPLKQRLLCESGVDMDELEGLRHSLGQLLARVTAHS